MNRYDGDTVKKQEREQGHSLNAEAKRQRLRDKRKPMDAKAR